MPRIRKNNSSLYYESGDSIPNSNWELLLLFIFLMHFIIPEVIWQCQGWGPDSSPYIWFCNKQFYAYNK